MRPTQTCQSLVEEGGQFCELPIISTLPLWYDLTFHLLYDRTATVQLIHPRHPSSRDVMTNARDSLLGVAQATSRCPWREVNCFWVRWKQMKPKNGLNFKAGRPFSMISILKKWKIALVAWVLRASQSGQTCSSSFRWISTTKSAKSSWSLFFCAAVPVFGSWKSSSKVILDSQLYFLYECWKYPGWSLNWWHIGCIVFESIVCV